MTQTSSDAVVASGSKRMRSRLARAAKGALASATLCGVLAGTTILSAGTAAAEDWHTNLTVYSLVPWVDLGVATDAGATTDASADPSDIIEALDFTFMVAGETYRDRISLLYDLMYTKLGSSGTLSGPLSSNVDANMKMLIGTFAVGYEVQRNDTSMVQVFGGARYVKFENSVNAVGGGPIGVVAGIDRDEDYLEPMVGIRGRTRLNDRTTLGGFFNVGGFGVGSDLTWDAYVGVDYALAPNRSLNMGFRYLSIEYDGGDATINMDQYGPVIGMTFKF